jgi:hypothetical protein
MNATSLDVENTIHSVLDEEDRVIIYPTFGHLSADGRSWHLGISGVVYEPGRNNLRRRMLLRVLQRLMRVPSEALQTELFRDRINCFLVGTERGKRIAVQVGDQVQMLQRPSKRNGHFRGSIELALPEANELTATPSQNGWLNVDVVTETGDCERFSGQAQLIGQTGTSVVSDIDDTIKLSEVGDRRRLLRNTFLRDFQAVDGMADVYSRWSQQGAAFHYVSSSPWQLYSSLQELMQNGGFPEGSFHLRSIRLRDPSILRLFFARRSGKRRVIRTILRMFPHRKFVMVGDSGERDPEIYGHLARQFPRQVRRILIRRVHGRTLSVDRLHRAFRDLPRDKWQTFQSPSELGNLSEIS